MPERPARGPAKAPLRDAAHGSGDGHAQGAFPSGRDTDPRARTDLVLSPVQTGSRTDPELASEGSRAARPDPSHGAAAPTEAAGRGASRRPAARGASAGEPVFAGRAEVDPRARTESFLPAVEVTGAPPVGEAPRASPRIERAAPSSSRRAPDDRAPTEEAIPAVGLPPHGGAPSSSDSPGQGGRRSLELPASPGEDGAEPVFAARGSITKLLRMEGSLAPEQIAQMVRDRFEHEVAVLFSDIEGSTAYFEGHGDVAGRQMIQRHNDALFPIVKQHRGRIVKTIGDAIMAVFPNPPSAVAAAIAMQQTLTSQNAQRAGDEIHVRIGINFGTALVNERDGDVFGDTINVAARVQSEAEPGEILVSGAVAQRLPPELKRLRLGSFSMKGKRRSVELFEILWGAPGGSRRHARRRLRIALVAAFVTALLLGAAAVLALGPGRFLSADAPRQSQLQSQPHRKRQQEPPRAQRAQRPTGTPQGAPGAACDDGAAAGEPGSCRPPAAAAGAPPAAAPAEPAP